MIDSVIAGTGNSRYLRTSISASTTWEDALTMLRAGTFPIDLAGINLAGFTTLGTALNSDTLLKSAVITALGLDADATPSDAWEAIIEMIENMSTMTASITLSSASWSGSNPYAQTVTISGYTVTANTRVDITCNYSTINSLAQDGVSAIYAENNSGTITVYAVGAAPTSNITVTATIYETKAVS